MSSVVRISQHGLAVKVADDGDQDNSEHPVRVSGSWLLAARTELLCRIAGQLHYKKHGCTGSAVASRLLVAVSQLWLGT